MSRRLLAALVCVATAAGVLGFGAPASALGPTAYGWWSRFQPSSSPVPAPPPPNAPSDGLYVAVDPIAPAAVAAVSYAVPTVAPSKLVLSIAPNRTGVPVIDACPATRPYRPAQNAPMSEAPTRDCSKLKVRGVVAADGTTVTFDLPATFISAGGMLDVVLVPVGPAPFSTPFHAPQDESLQGPAAEGGDVPELEPSDVPLSDGESFSASFEDPQDLGGTAFPSDGFGSFPAPTFTPGTTSFVPGPPTGPNVPRVVPPRPAPPVPAVNTTPLPIPDDRLARILAMVLLLGMSGVAFRLGDQRDRSPRLLGGLAARRAGGDSSGDAGSDREDQATAAAPGGAAPEPVVVGGIGRFARPRTGTPNRL